MFSINPLDWQKEDGCLFASAINSWFEVSKKKDDTCFEWLWLLDGEGECLCSGTASTLEEAAEIANKKWHDELCIYLTEEKRNGFYASNDHGTMEKFTKRKEPVGRS